MPNITTCSNCGKCYEESSEESANEYDRICIDCWSENKYAEDMKKIITGPIHNGEETIAKK